MQDDLLMLEAFHNRSDSILLDKLMSFFKEPVTSICWELVPWIKVGKTGRRYQKYMEMIIVSSGTNIYFMTPSEDRSHMIPRRTFNCEDNIFECIFQSWVSRIAYTCGCGIGTIDIHIESDESVRLGINEFFIPRWSTPTTTVCFPCMAKLYPKREFLLTDSDGCIFTYDDQTPERIKQRDELKIPFRANDMKVKVDPIAPTLLHLAAVGEGKLSILKIDVTGREPLKYYELAKKTAKALAWSPGDQLAINIIYSDGFLRQWRMDKDSDTWEVWSIHPVAGEGMDIGFIRDQMNFMVYATTKSVVAEYYEQPGEMIERGEF